MWHFVLPVLVASYAGFAYLSRLMRGAILDVAIADIAQLGDDALLITTQLGPESALAGLDGLVNLRLLVIPTPDTLAKLLDSLASKARGE